MAGTILNVNQALQPLNALLQPLAKAGFGAPLNLTPGLVVLETKGRVSGRNVSVPLVGYLAYPYVTIGTVRSNSQWIKNLRAADDAHLWVWGRRWGYEKIVTTDHWIVGRLRQNRSSLPSA